MRLAGLGYDSLKNMISEDIKNETNYSKITNHIFKNFYVYGDSFTEGMKSVGNQTFECLYDFKPLQTAWAKENNIKYKENTWQADIVLAQINKFKPDVIYFQDIHGLPLNIKLNLKNKFPFIKLLVLFRGWPGGDINVYQNEFKFADIIFVGSPILLRKLEQTNLPKPILMYHFFDPRILDNIKNELKYDFTFVGTTGYQQRGHSKRYWTLIELIKKTNIELWPQEYHWANDPYPRNIDKKKYINQKNNNFNAEPKFPLSFLFPNRCHGSDKAYDVCFGLKMYQIIRSSKISFNRHCNDAENEWDNMRIFQATGLGSCLLLEEGSNSKDLFEPNKEVVTYSNIDECIEKVNYLLNHEVERSKIAKAGQDRTLKDHTMYQRCKEMHDIISKKL